MAKKTFMSNTPIEGESFESIKNTNASNIVSNSAQRPGPGRTTIPLLNPYETDGAFSNSMFTFNENNVTQNSSDEYNINFKPNILDFYDSYTYHWKLFITPLSAAASGKVLDRNSQTIIVESGISDLTIDKIEFEGIAVPSTQAGTGTQTTLKFEIFEPGSAELLDKMFYEASALGIGNWLVMPCFLQLEFRGREYNDGGGISPLNTNQNIGGPLADLKWVWPIKITQCKTQVNEGGARYEFDAIFYDELAQSNPYFSVQHNVTLDSLDTFGSAMESLEDKLNADQYEKLIDNYSIPDTYKIVVDPVLSNIQLISPQNNTSTKRNADFIDLNKKSATFNSGTGIDKIVDSLLLSTKYYQEKLQGSDTPSSKPKTANTVEDQMKKMWRIVTETKPVAFDALRQDNAVEITVYIVQYDVGTLDSVASQTGQTPSTVDATKRRINEYLDKKILNKIYNYIFTGLNDQIINFDLNLNFSFAAALSRFGGIYLDSGTQTTGMVANKNSENEKNVSEQVRKTIQYANTAKNDKDIESKISEVKKTIESSSLSNEDKSRYTTLLNNARPIQRRLFTSSIKQSGGITTSGEIDKNYEETLKNAKSLATPTENNLKFISDVRINTPESKQAYEIMLANRKGKLRPIPYKETNQEVNASNNIDPDSNAGRARVASVFSTALYSTLDASLQTIKMTIKGDPYWLYPKSINSNIKVLPYKSNIKNQMEAIKLIKNEHLISNNLNLYGTDNFLILRFRAPKIYDEYQGTVEPFTEIETFSGVYRVISITSKFEGGLFTQELTCNLDPLINLKDLPGFLRSIDIAVRQPQINDKENTLKSKSLPQKTNRIQSSNNNNQVIEPLSIETNTSNIPTKIIDLYGRFI